MRSVTKSERRSDQRFSVLEAFNGPMMLSAIRQQHGADYRTFEWSASAE